MRIRRIITIGTVFLFSLTLFIGCGNKNAGSDNINTVSENTDPVSGNEVSIEGDIPDGPAPDTTAPTITLNKDSVEIQLGDEFDYSTLIDSITDDSSLPENITVDWEIVSGQIEHAGTVSALLKATDEAGNTSSKEITITVIDEVAPKLTLMDSPVTSLLDEELTWQQLVSIVSDNDDTATVTFTVTEGDLDKAGVCTVTVTATDASGNSTTDEIQVYRKKRVTNSLGWDITGIEGQPYLVGVNRTTCQVTVYGKDENGNYSEPVIAFPCSVGKEGCETPTGRFVTGKRYEWRKMVDGTYGSYATVISKEDGILFHSVPYYTPNHDDLEWPEYNKLGTPASLGCVRLIYAHAGWIYSYCPTGFVTIIYDADWDPISHNGYTHIDPDNETTRVWDPSDPTEGNPWRE